MNYGYNPAQFIPDVSGLAKAGAELGQAVGTIADEVKVQNMLRTKRLELYDFYGQVVNQAAQELQEAGDPNPRKTAMSIFVPPLQSEKYDTDKFFERMRLADKKLATYKGKLTGKQASTEAAKMGAAQPVPKQIGLSEQAVGEEPSMLKQTAAQLGAGSMMTQQPAQYDYTQPESRAQAQVALGQKYGPETAQQAMEPYKGLKPTGEPQTEAEWEDYKQKEVQTKVDAATKQDKILGFYTGIAEYGQLVADEQEHLKNLKSGLKDIQSRKEEKIIAALGKTGLKADEANLERLVQEITESQKRVEKWQHQVDIQDAALKEEQKRRAAELKAKTEGKSKPGTTPSPIVTAEKLNKEVRASLADKFTGDLIESPLAEMGFEEYRFKPGSYSQRVLDDPEEFKRYVYKIPTLAIMAAGAGISRPTENPKSPGGGSRFKVTVVK